MRLGGRVVVHHAVAQEDAGFEHAAHGVGNAERVSFAPCTNQDPQRPGDAQSIQSGDTASRVFVDANCLCAKWPERLAATRHNVKAWGIAPGNGIIDRGSPERA